TTSPPKSPASPRRSKAPARRSNPCWPSTRSAPAVQPAPTATATRPRAKAARPRRRTRIRSQTASARCNRPPRAPPRQIKRRLGRPLPRKREFKSTDDWLPAFATDERRHSFIRLQGSRLLDPGGRAPYNPDRSAHLHWYGRLAQRESVPFT